MYIPNSLSIAMNCDVERMQRIKLNGGKIHRFLRVHEDPFNETIGLRIGRLNRSPLYDLSDDEILSSLKGRYLWYGQIPFSGESPQNLHAPYPNCWGMHELD